MDPDDEGVVAAWGRIAVAELAPGELPLFGAFRVAHFGGGATVSAPGKDVLIGFGVDSAVALLTPVLLAVCHKAWDVVGDKAGEKAWDGAGTLLKRLRQRLGGTEPDRAAESFSAEELELVRSAVLGTGAELGLPEPQRLLLAEAVVGSLVLPAPPGPGAGGPAGGD